MSELSTGQRWRSRRADAQRNVAAIVEAAVALLNERPDASMGDVARAAGVTRPTVYAHFSSREALLSAAVDRITQAALAEMDAIDTDRTSPSGALLLLMKPGWRTLERYPGLLHAAGTAHGHHRDDAVRHDPVRARLEAVITRGQEAGDFNPTASAQWLTAIAIAIGHAAGDEVATGRMTTDQAWSAIKSTTLRALKP